MKFFNILNGHRTQVLFTCLPKQGAQPREVAWAAEMPSWGFGPALYLWVNPEFSASEEGAYARFEEDLNLPEMDGKLWGYEPQNQWYWFKTTTQGNWVEVPTELAVKLRLLGDCTRGEWETTNENKFLGALCEFLDANGF